MTTLKPLILPTAGNVSLALLTGFSADIFGQHSIDYYGKHYPQLLTLGFLLEDTDLEPIVVRGPFMLARCNAGPILTGTYQCWASVLPLLLKDPTTAAVAGKINTILSRMGLSCR